MNTAQVNATEKQHPTVEDSCRGSCYVPAVDIVETPHEFVLTADVPGATADKIDVSYDEGELRVHAPVDPRRKNEQSFLLEEYGTGDYFRSFRLSREIDAAKIEARFADGVLTLKLPKVEAIKPRKIAVNAG